MTGRVQRRATIHTAQSSKDSPNYDSVIRLNAEPAARLVSASIWIVRLAYLPTGTTYRGRPNSRLTCRHLDHNNASLAFISSSNRPYGLTCPHINGVNAA